MPGLFGLVLLVEDLVDLGGEVLGEVGEGAGGGLMGVEVELGGVDVGEFEIPEEILLAGFKFEFPHFEGHFNVVYID